VTRVGIIGLGYVGLPLAAAFAETGTEVLGVDVSAEKVASVNAGRSYVEDVESTELARHLQSGCLQASTDPAGCASATRSSSVFRRPSTSTATPTCRT